MLCKLCFFNNRCSFAPFYVIFRKVGTRSKRDYYEVLGVSPNSSLNEIKIAFYELSKKYHPDVFRAENNNADDKLAGDKFLELKEAYDALRDGARRNEYDSQRNATFGASYRNNGRFGLRRKSTFSYEGGFSQSENNRNVDRTGQELRQRDRKTVGRARAGAFYDPGEEMRREELDQRRIRLLCALAVFFVIGVNVIFIWLTPNRQRSYQSASVAKTKSPTV